MNIYLHLPCLRGVIGDWTFFSSVMKVKDIVNRVITVSQSEELYSKKINEILQREIDEKRVDKIRDYLIGNNEHFFSSIIVAIYRGNPIWSDFDIESHFKIENKEMDPESSSFIQNKLGVLSLSGEEIIFALDGQHRVRGFQEAYKLDKAIGDEEIPLIFVVHNQLAKERTRRLFTVLNKYAQKPKEAELIILDEDDTAAVITRRLVEKHRIIKLPNAIANSNTANILASDNISFTTLVTINRINKAILEWRKLDYTKRPDEEVIQECSDECFDFWDYLFNTFPQVERTIRGERVINDDEVLFNRNSKTGGNLILRPVGQQIFAALYISFQGRKDGLNELSRKIPLLDFNLSGEYCNHIIWHGKMDNKASSLQKNLFLYVLGINNDEKIHDEISRQYEQYGQPYLNKFQQI